LLRGTIPFSTFFFLFFFRKKGAILDQLEHQYIDNIFLKCLCPSLNQENVRALLRKRERGLGFD
jgi:hypothetical protein